MTFHAEIKVMLKRSILDPQGRAVEKTLHRLGETNVTDVRIGKHLTLILSGERAALEAQLEKLIEEMLSNPVMEEAHYTLTETSANETGPGETDPDGEKPAAETAK